MFARMSTVAARCGVALAICFNLGVSSGCAQEDASGTAIPGLKGDPFIGRGLFVESRPEARRQAVAWRPYRPDDAQLMAELAKHPVAFWLRDDTPTIELTVRGQVRQAQRQGTLPLFAVAGIPDRDCTGQDEGRLQGTSAYLDWVQKVRRGIGRAEAIVVLEPSALRKIDDCSDAKRTERFTMLSEAIGILERGGVSVYLDAGRASKNPKPEIIDVLRSAGIKGARGFALNVGDYVDTKTTITYGVWLAESLEKPFVVDTSRNGRGAPEDDDLCNARGRGLGIPPNTVDTRHELIDAYLWVKAPGMSDGECNGGPKRDEWWPKLALELVKNTPWIRAAALMPSAPTPPLPPEPGPRDDLMFEGSKWADQGSDPPVLSP